MDIIVCLVYIKLGEVPHALELMMDEIFDEGERVFIFSCNDIECSIVLDEAELTILLLDKEDWGTQWGFRLLYVTSSESFL
jgi:hypothetical protein